MEITLQQKRVNNLVTSSQIVRISTNKHNQRNNLSAGLWAELFSRSEPKKRTNL